MNKYDQYKTSYAKCMMNSENSLDEIVQKNDEMVWICNEIFLMSTLICLEYGMNSAKLTMSSHKTTNHNIKFLINHNDTLLRLFI